MEECKKGRERTWSASVLNLRPTADLVKEREDSESNGVLSEVVSHLEDESDRGWGEDGPGDI